MPTVSSEFTVFHGTEHAFDGIRLPTPEDGIARHGMDQFGTGVYLATNEDPDAARAYASTYANDAGVVLTTSLEDGQFNLLNYDQPLGDAAADNLRRSIANIDTGNETLNRYYREMAGGINAETSVEEFMDRVSNPMRFERWQSQTLDADLSPSEFDRLLQSNRRAISNDVVGGFRDTESLTQANIDEIRSATARLASENPRLASFYEQFSDSLRVGMDGEDVWSNLGDTDSAKPIFDANRPQTAQFTSFEMDAHSTRIMQGANIDGLYVPLEDTIVIKGQAAVDRLPDLRVDSIVGRGPAAGNIHTADGRVPAVGEVMVPSRASAAEYIAGQEWVTGRTPMAGDNALSAGRGIHTEVINPENPQQLLRNLNALGIPAEIETGTRFNSVLPEDVEVVRVYRGNAQGNSPDNPFNRLTGAGADLSRSTPSDATIAAARADTTVRLPEVGEDQFGRRTVPDGRGGFQMERERIPDPIETTIAEPDGDARIANTEQGVRAGQSRVGRALGAADSDGQNRLYAELFERAGQLAENGSGLNNASLSSGVAVTGRMSGALAPLKSVTPGWMDAGLAGTFAATWGLGRLVGGATMSDAAAESGNVGYEVIGAGNVERSYTYASNGEYLNSAQEIGALIFPLFPDVAARDQAIALSNERIATAANVYDALPAGFTGDNDTLNHLAHLKQRIEQAERAGDGERTAGWRGEFQNTLHAYLRNGGSLESISESIVDWQVENRDLIQQTVNDIVALAPVDEMPTGVADSNLNSVAENRIAAWRMRREGDERQDELYTHEMRLNALQFVMNGGTVSDAYVQYFGENRRVLEGADINGQGGTLNDLNEIAEAVQAFDADLDGHISIEELGAGLNRHSVTMSADTDGDFKLSAEEIMAELPECPVPPSGRVR